MTIYLSIYFSIHPSIYLSIYTWKVPPKDPGLPRTTIQGYSPGLATCPPTILTGITTPAPNQNHIKIIIKT